MGEGEPPEEFELPQLTSSGSPAPPSDEEEALEEAEEVSVPAPLSSKTQTRVASPDDAPDSEEEERNVTRVGARILLEVTKGPDEGKSKRFNRVRMVLGRAEGCEFRLADTSVSRRHAELVQGEEGILCRDLASGNGTRVNGENVTEQLVGDGDRISIGATEITVIDEAATLKRLRDEARRREEEEANAAEAAREAKARAEAQEAAAQARDAEARKKNGAPVPWSAAQKAIVAAASVLAGLLMVLLFVNLGPSGPDKEELARERMERALFAFKGGKFEYALSLIKEAEKLFPGIDAQKLLPRAQTEWEAQVAVSTASAALEQNRFDDARRALQGFPRGASDARQKERDEWVSQIAVREMQHFRFEAERLFRDGKLEEGRAYYLRLPPELQEPLKALLDTVEEELIARERQQAAREAELRGRRQQKMAAERQAQFDAALSAAARKFHAGEYPRAANECDRVAIQFREDAGIRTRARQLQEWIPSFGRYFEEGTRKCQASQWSACIVPLRKARELYLKIGFPGAIGQQIDELLASAFVATSRDAMARGDWIQAYRLLKEGRRFDAQDTRFREGLRRLEQKAQELYHEGYLSKEGNLEKALELFKTVLQISPPGSEPYEKARRQIAALKSGD